MKTRILLAILPLAACQATVSTEPVSITASTLDNVPVERAVGNIAHARCARELSCGNIGIDAMEGCTRDVRSATRQGVLSRCPDGVAPGYLEACVESVRNESCGTAESMTERLAASCPGAKLCR